MADTRTEITVSKQFQMKSNWCWAATARCVDHTYNRQSNSTQCSIAKSTAGTNCENCNDDSCNDSHNLVDPLNAVRRFGSIRQSAVPWTTVEAEVAAGRVVCACVSWNGDGGHFVTICGASRIGRTRYLHVFDPSGDFQTGENITLDHEIIIIKYSQFKRSYLNLGGWICTYFTVNGNGAS